MEDPRTLAMAVPDAGGGRFTMALAAATQVFHELDRERLLQRIVDAARQIVGARYAALGVFDEGRRIEAFYTSGLSAEQRRRIKANLPEGKGLLGAMLDRPGPLRLDDLSKHHASVGFPAGHPAMKSFLGVPVRFQGRLMGNLYLTEKEGGQPFNQEDETLVSFFAAQAGIALENARLYLQAMGEVRSLQTLLDSIPDAVYTTDRERRVTRMNRAAAELRGGSPEEFVGRLVCEVFPYTGADGKPLCPDQCPTGRALETGEQVAITDARLASVQRTTGEFPAAVIIAPIADHQGVITGVVEICRDVSHLRAAEELRNNIISLVSHELRTPLFHIKGFASSLLQPDVEWDEETRNDFIRTIDQEADRLTRLVSDLLDMSRLESGKATLEPTDVSVGQLIRGGIRRAQPFLRDHKVEAEPSLDALVAHVDVFHVERVLENLLENAAKYSPAGTAITVSASRKRGVVEVVVKDQGEGIPLEERERVFERFVRLGERSGRPPGTGLGLSICKAIVEAHGGRIWVDGLEGKGAELHFTIPLAKAARNGKRRAVGRATGRRDTGEARS